MSRSTDAAVGHGVEHWAYQAPSPFRDPAEIRELWASPARPVGLPGWGEDEFDVEAEFEAYDELDPTMESEADEDGFSEEDYLAADLLEEAEGSDHPLASVFSLPRLALDAMAKGGWATAIAIAVGTGQRDVNSLTNMVFWFRHPQLIGEKLRNDQADLAREWVQIRDTIVRPALAGRTATPTTLPAAPASPPGPGTAGRRTSIPPDGLRWYGKPDEETPELMAFMHKVYRLHVARSIARGESFVDTLPSGALDYVSHPPGLKRSRMRARKDAAASALEMFAAAQAELEAKKLQGQIRFDVLSGYRSADEQFAIWQGKNRGGKKGFPFYYRATRAIRQHPTLGGEHSDAAAAELVARMGKYIAAPGYSNHQDGLALDLGTVKGQGALKKLYKGAWFHTWMRDNAHKYHFEQLPTEAWHWTYRPPKAAAAEAEWSDTEAWTHEVVPPTVPAGKMPVPKLRVLARHRGKGPDAVLHWNAMSSVPAEIDVVVHLHGFSAAGKTLVNHYQTWAGLDLAPVDGATGTGRGRPTLTVLPRGNNTGIKTRNGQLFKYTFPALTTGNGLDELVRESLQQFADRVGGLPPKVARLILTAHSGGGASLMRIVRQRRDDIDEIHVFDGLYQDPTALAEWAARHILADRKAVEAGGVASGAMRVFYGPGTRGNSLRLHDAVAVALRGAPASVTTRYRVEASTLGHMQIPRQYGWRMLSDPAADVPDAAPPPARKARARREDELDLSESPLPAQAWDESEERADEWEDEWEDEAQDEWEEEGEDAWDEDGEDGGEDEGDEELQPWDLEEPETWGEEFSDEAREGGEEEDLADELDEGEYLADELDEGEYLAGELDQEGPNDESTRKPASPRASIPASWGGFGAELRQNKAMSEGEGAVRAIALLKKSPTFDSMARRVGGRYRSRAKDLDAWLNVTARYRGKRFLDIVGSPGPQASFNANESPFTDEIRIAVVNQADMPRVHTQQLAHEISHVVRFLFNRAARPRDLWGAIQAAIDTEEVQARLVERKILSEIRRADRRAPSFPTSSTDPKQIEREISGLGLTYLESAVLYFKLGNAETAESLSALEAKTVRDGITRAFPARPARLSEYGRTWFNILKAQKDWQRFQERFSPAAPNYLLERDRLANQHVRTILDREVMYRS